MKTYKGLRAILGALGLSLLALAPAHALLKIDGQWSEENWSDRTDPDNAYKKYCRDEQGEHIEEMVLVYSNGDAARATFELNEELSEFDVYGRTYKVASGTATVEGQAGPEGCRSTYSLNTGSIAPLDGRLSIRLVPDLAGRPPHATTGFGITVVPGTTITLECGGQTTVASGPVSVQWLGFDIALPFAGAEISSDGQTIRGTKTHVDATSGTRTVTEWDFHAEAE